MSLSLRFQGTMRKKHVHSKKSLHHPNTITCLLHLYHSARAARACCARCLALWPSQIASSAVGAPAGAGARGCREAKALQGSVDAWFGTGGGGGMREAFRAAGAGSKGSTGAGDGVQGSAGGDAGDA
eukprot:1161923-Pelagomonas_calceolata.AAC.7